MQCKLGKEIAPFKYPQVQFQDIMYIERLIYKPDTLF